MLIMFFGSTMRMLRFLPAKGSRKEKTGEQESDFMSKLILASKSPRRKELLSLLVPENSFACIPAAKEEVLEGTDIDQAILSIARSKAEEIQARYPDDLILSADTVVVDNGKVLGKPRCKQEASRTLRCLSGRWHEVKTAMVLLGTDESGQAVHKEEVLTTRVHFRTLQEADILKYVAGGTCMDKAGSYGIQDVDFADKVDGSYTNVIGLPVELAGEWLEELSLAEGQKKNRIPKFLPRKNRKH